MQLFIPACIALALPGVAIAATDNNKYVSYVGVQSGNYSYVRFASPLSGGCSNDVAYIDISNDSGKAEFVVSVTAKATGLIISRIDYTVTSGTCYVTIIQM